MQIFKKTSQQREIIHLNAIPNNIKYIKNNPSELIFDDDITSCTTGCLRCNNPKCMIFSETEIECTLLQNFPSDKDDGVCPVGAITKNTETGLPSIDKSTCIDCGVCIQRCPIGAIYYNGEEIVVNDSISTMQIKVPVTDNNIKVQNKQIKTLSLIEKQGTFINEGKKILEGIYKKLSKLPSNYHNNVVRSLLIGLGCNSAIRRIGDVYTRMDAVYVTQLGTFGVVEVEFGKDTLDASRGILDDIAVLNVRYGIQAINNNALVICLQLPNVRQGYWQVIKDIKTIIGLKINTITIGALMILLWNQKSFDPKEISYYVDYDNMTIRNIVETHIGRDILLPDKYHGILEPQK